MNDTHAQPGSHLPVLGLERNPFPITPDAACYFHTPELQAEMGEAVHCVMSRMGFVLITGEIGLGKSTFVRRLTDSVLARDCAVAFVLNTFLHGADLLRAINLDFGLEPGASFAEDVSRLNAFLVDQHARGRTALIIVDDAQNLCLESLELMRMLSNFETGQQKLVQILLCGQPELTDTLSDPSIRQLSSRIVKHVELRPLTLEQTRDYVGFRLTSAGSEGRISLASSALPVLHRLSAGNPRRMHLILDRCLYGLVAGRTRAITPALVRMAARESGIRVARPLHRRRATRLAAGVAVAGLATVVAASVLTRHGEQPHAPLPAPAVSVVAPATAATSGTQPHGRLARMLDHACLERFGLSDADGQLSGPLHAADMPALRAAVSRQRQDLAVFDVPQDLPMPAPGRDACELSAAHPHVVLWQPGYGLPAFAFGARGEGIRHLQQALARSGQYAWRLDGLVGSRTAAAIAAFQRGHGLSVTGYPDDMTRYFIEQAAGSAGSQTP